MRSFWLSFLIALLAATIGPRPVEAQQQFPLPSQEHSSVKAPSTVPTTVLPQVDEAALRAEDRETQGQVGPHRYGTVVKTQFTPERYGTWERLPSGNWLWRLRIQSQGATSLSVVFTAFGLPEGATLFVHGSKGDLVRGPYTHRDATNGQHRTPLVFGDEVTIEMEVPRSRRPNVNLTIGKVVHGYRSFQPSPTAKKGSKSASCHLDVTCDQADPWRKQARSVALVSYEKGGSSFVCSGSLLNNTSEDQTPYFLTAEHCVNTPRVANTMVFIWNFQSPSCRPPGSVESGNFIGYSRVDQTSSGAILRARYGNTHRGEGISGKSDLALVEIDDHIPLHYNVYFNGWARLNSPPFKNVSIHHPQGHGKRISFDNDRSAITGWGEFPQASSETTHWYLSDWETGIIEGGSSGGPLFSANHRVVGVLSGASRRLACSGGAPNDSPSWYGRITPGFENGDYRGNTLADFLAPNNPDLTTTLDGTPQTDPNDDVPPARVNDLTVTELDTTAMTVEWTAPGDNGNQGIAYEHDLRYSTSPITTPSDFEAATHVAGLPFPDTAGTVQQKRVTGLMPDSTYYFALQSTGDGRNSSPLGTSGGTKLPDMIPPSSITDFRISDVNTSEQAISLKWTATGDDRRRGRATAYDLRFATDPIETESDFRAATRVQGLPSPGPAGTTESVVVDAKDGLKQGKTYYFALSASDNANNSSGRASPDEKAVLVKDIRVSQGSAASTPTLRFVVSKTQEVRVSLYDLLGRRVGVLKQEEVREGLEETVRINSATSAHLSSGPYFVRFNGETFTKTRKVIVVN
ncbi:MAG: fibronectin type III domain-containing protein [Salinibacter sp.]